MEFGSLLRQLQFCRFPIFFGLVLALIGPVVWFVVPRLLANILIVHNRTQVAFLTLICLCMSTILAAQLWIILQNGPDRFSAEWNSLSTDRGNFPTQDDNAAGARQSFSNSHKLLGAPVGKYWTWTRIGTIVWLFVSFSLPVCSIVFSDQSRSATAVSHGFPDNPSWGSGLVGMLAGFACFLFILWITTILVGRLVPIQSVHSGFFPLENLTWVEKEFVPPSASRGELYHETSNGYFRASENNGGSRFAAGHLELIFMTLVVFVMYSTIGLYVHWVSPVIDAGTNFLPTSFYAVVVLIFASSAFGAVAFFTDLYRIPTLLIFGVIFGIAFWTTHRQFLIRIDSTELIDGAPPASNHEEASGPRLAASETQKLPKQILADSDQRRTLVVITAPGGGIHAAAWTAQVLTGLHERYSAEFAESIGLISAVSGGSLGAMHYLNSYQDLQKFKEAGRTGEFMQRIDDVMLDATASSLEHVGWGLAYPDLLNFVLPGTWLSSDRGTIVESHWNRLMSLRCRKTDEMKYDAPTLQNWGRLVGEGRLPGFVFNATEVESGRRVLFSPLPFETKPELQQRRLDPRHFRSIYGAEQGDGDIDIATCVRLSATFPYVFPLALSRESTGDQGRFGHVVDGGYADNEGIISAVTWLGDLVSEPATLEKFDRVVLIRIRHHGVTDPPEDDAGLASPTPLRGPLAAIAGPAFAALTVRDASQVERGQLETDLLTKLQRIREETVKEVYQQLPDPEKSEFLKRSPQYQKFASPEPDMSQEASKPFVKTLFLDFVPAGDGEQPPLNWKLTPKQFSQYRCAWDEITNEETKSEGIAVLDEYFLSNNR